MDTSEWTGEALDSLRALDAVGRSVSEIAQLLGRDPADVEERLALVRATGRTGDDAEPSYGPDEEGDVTPAVESSTDAAAWVHDGKA